MIFRFEKVLVLLNIVTACSCANAQVQPASNPTVLVTFYAMGDVPYKPEEDRLLPSQIADLPDDGQFVVHVGDIKSGSTPCDESVFQKVSGMLSKSRTPVFIIPGDNEWNDCADPSQAWTFWNQYFRRFDRRWNHTIPIFRQIEHEENFSFVINDVLFVGINLVGGYVHDPGEWQTAPRRRSAVDPAEPGAVRRHGEQSGTVRACDSQGRSRRLLRAVSGAGSCIR